MNQKAVLIIALRICALLLFISTLDTVQQLLQQGVVSYEMKLQVSVKLFLLSFVTPIFMKLVLAIILWKFPQLLIKNISGFDMENNLINAKEFIIPLLVLLGIYFIFNALIDMAYFGYILYEVAQMAENPYSPAFSNPANEAGLISCILELTIGLWLVFGKKGILGLVRKFRRTEVI